VPELPDVEILRRYVEATSLGRRVEHAHVFDEAMLSGATRQKLASALVGSRLEAARRHGKFLGIACSRNGWLVLHFGMTGSLRAGDSDDFPDNAALGLELADGSNLAYTTRRRIGEISVTDDFDRFSEERELGPDALALDEDGFVELVRSRCGAIKSLLMNQSAIAGIGNVYADEVLFGARIRPSRKARARSEREAPFVLEVRTVSEEALRARCRARDRLREPQRRIDEELEIDVVFAAAGHLRECSYDYELSLEKPDTPAGPGLESETERKQELTVELAED